MAADKPKTGNTGTGSSTNRSAGTRPSGRTARKSVTIDLEAKEVKVAAEKKAAEEAAKAAASEDAKAKAEEKTQQTAKPDPEPTKAAGSEAKPEKGNKTGASGTKIDDKPATSAGTEKQAPAAKSAEPEKTAGKGSLNDTVAKAGSDDAQQGSKATAGSVPKSGAAAKANDTASKMTAASNASDDKKASTQEASPTDKSSKDEGSDKKSSSTPPTGGSGSGGGDGNGKQSGSDAGEPPRKSGAGIGALVAAGVIGGLLVVGAGAGLHQMGLISVASPDQIKKQDALQSLVETSQERMQKLEDRIASLQTDLEQTAPDTSLIDQLKERIASFEDTAATNVDQMRAALGEAYDSRMQSLKQGLDELRGYVNEGAAGDGAAVSSLKAALDNLKAQVDDLSESGKAASQEALDTVTQQVTSLQEEASKLQQKASELAELPGDLEKQRAIVSSLETRIAQTAANLQAQVQTQAETKVQLDALVSQLNSLSDTVTTQLDRLEQRVGDASAQERAARAIAVASLQAAVDSGRPYQTELSAVEAVMTGDKSQLGQLKEYASTGIPTRSALMARFGGAARAMSAADVTEQSDGVVDRLMSSAQSLVSIRTPGDNEGTTPRDRLGQMEARVAEGDLKGAIEAYEQLPEPVKAAGAGWVGQVRARLQADALVAQVTDEVLKSLATASQQ